jgi:EmrB/QacA subfamily drug resistance transporter
MEVPMSHDVNTEEPLIAEERRWLALAVLCAAQFMLVLDITVVNVALPDLAGDLTLTRTATTWVITLYTLFFGGLMLVGGRSADLFGPRRVLITGLGLFTAASLAAGLAGTAETVLVARGAQGLAAAFLSPAALATVAVTFHGDEHRKAFGIWATMGTLGSAVGVVLGGLLTAGPGWRWIFFINVPVGIVVATLLTALLRPVAPRPRSGSVDVAGGVLVTSATALTIYALTTAGDRGWTSVTTIGLLILAGILYVAFGLVEQRVAQPLIAMPVLGRKAVYGGAGVMLVATALLISSFFLGSFYLQHVSGWSAVRTGLAFLPVALATFIGAGAGGHLLAHVGARVIASAAFVIASVGAGVVALGIGEAQLVVGMSVSALGIGAAFVAAMTSAMGSAGPGEVGAVSGAVNTFHELGGALGVAALSSVAAASLGPVATDAGFVDAFRVSAVAALVAAALCAALLPAAKGDPDAPRFVH